MTVTTILAGDDGWGTQTIRRTLRLLASHSPNFADTVSRERALRLLWDILNRRGMPSEIYETTHSSPLLISGNGPILIITHLDDPRPSAQIDAAPLPSMQGNALVGPGVVRKAGVLAAVGLLASERGNTERFTLVVETDRFGGSRALEGWLNGPGAHRALHWALCESVDLPVPAPALYRGATGRLLIELTISDDRPRLEGFYAGVVPDNAHALTQALGALKSVDGEVLIPGFYDAVIMPGPPEMAALLEIAPHVSGWVMHDRAATHEQLTANHLTLGGFLAPALSVMSVNVSAASPWLPRAGHATVDIRVMPGQDVATIARQTTEFLHDRLAREQIEINVSLACPSARGMFPPLPDAMHAPLSFPVAPGDSPAGMIEELGVPTTGFSTVWRDPSTAEECIELAAITAGTAFLEALCTYVPQPSPLQRT